MKLNRFLSFVAIFAVLMSVSSANAQGDLYSAVLKWAWNKHLKNKEIKDKMEGIEDFYNDWVKLLENYASKTGKVGDCQAIGFRDIPNNRLETPNFSYECGIDGDIAFLNAKNKIKIGDCDIGSVFKAEFDIRKNYLDTRSVPRKDACIFFQPLCKALNSDFCPSDMVFVENGKYVLFPIDTYKKHEVSVDNFCIGKYEITQKEWREIMGSNPSYFRNCDNCPVEQVSWNDVQVFINKLNAKNGMNYRLPTEAEWEYAELGGCQSNNGDWRGSNDDKGVAWCRGNNQTHTVGTKHPNELGIYDMNGNVWEWVNDWYSDNGPTAANNYKGPSKGDGRVIRGDSWFEKKSFFANLNCRLDTRTGMGPDTRNNTIGFRLAHAPVDKAALQKTCQANGKVWENNACRGKTSAEITAEKNTCQANGKIWENNVCREKTFADVEAEKNTCQANGKVWENNACREKTAEEIDTGKKACQANGKVWDNNVCRGKTSAEAKAENQEVLIKEGAKLLQKLFK